MSYKFPTFKFLAVGLEKLRDPLYRNAFFLILTSALGGLLGLLFWLLVARYYTSEIIGTSASLISLAGFLGFISSLGFGVGLIRFLPSAPSGRNHRINTSFTLAGLTGLGIGLVFLGGLDIWSPSIAFVRNEWPYAAIFLAFTVGFALTPLVDSCFLAARKASYVLQRSLIYGILRLAIPLAAITTLGAFGIFFSFTVALLGALTFSLVLLMPRVYPGFLALPSIRLSGIRDMITYSIGNHIAILLLVIPSGILPLLILTQMSASSAAHFFIAWMMAAYLFVIPASASESLFIEGSHPGTYFTTDLVRSLRFGLLLLVPGVLFLFFAGPFLLGLFGAEYSTEGLGLLRILAISGFFVAINSTFFSFLKVSKRVKELILVSMTSGIGIIVVSYFMLDSFRILGTGIAFLSVQAAISSYVLVRNLGVSKGLAKRMIGIQD